MTKRGSIFLIACITLVMAGLLVSLGVWKFNDDIPISAADTPLRATAGHSEVSSSVPSSEILQPVSYTLTVTSADLSGNIKIGMYTTIWEGDSIIQTGYTPLSFTGHSGVTYSVSVSNYQSSVFDHWENQGTARKRVITLADDTTLISYYRTEPMTIMSSARVIEGTGVEDLIMESGVLVPLYMFPGNSGSMHWQKVIDEKLQHPSVPIVAIINPSSGPGTAKNSNIALWVEKLQSAGITPIGYIPDGYADTKNPGTRTITQMKDSVKKYHDWYDVDGIFFDEFPNKAGFESRYTELTGYAKSLGMKLTVGNPGASGSESYVGTVDVLNIVEKKGYIPLHWLRDCTVCSPEKGWQHLHNKRNFAMMLYDVANIDETFVKDASEWVGLMYITDGNDSNGRWMHVPSYFGKIVSSLDK